MADVTKIKEGMIIGNYKEMCNLLSESIKTGNSKKAQLKDWQRYFSYEKDGYKFIIVEIYSSPKPKEIRKGNNSIYIDYIELLLMHYLSEQDEYKTLFSTIELLEGLAFANNRYFSYRRIISEKDNKDFLLENSEETEDGDVEEEVSIADCVTANVISAIKDKDGLSVEEYDINNFFSRTYAKFNNILESALKSLRNRCLIDFEDRTFVVTEDDGRECHVVATEDERRFITDAEKMALDEMGFNKKSNVYLAYRGNEFNKKVRKILQDKYGIKYYYKRHSIVWLTDAIKRTIPSAEIDLKKKILNKRVISAVNKEAINRYNNRELKVKEEFKQFTQSLDEWGCALVSIDDYAKEIDSFRYGSDYIDNQMSLSAYFLEI